jgi:ABC transport system ATP-binding/permease protein
MQKLLLNFNGLSLSPGGRPILSDAALGLRVGERAALVGRNGEGKSTLLRIVAGVIQPDRGDVYRDPGCIIRYLPQEPEFADFSSIRDFAIAGLSPTDDEYQVQVYLDELGLDPLMHPSQLSGGEARKAALVRVLAARPDVLLLDEPTNHLDLPTVEWLETRLASIASAMVIVSHDRRFLATLTNRVIWVDRGSTRTLNDGFSGFERWRDAVLAEEEKQQDLLDQRIAREEHWMRYGVTARRKRNMRRVDLLASLRNNKKSHVHRTGAVRMEASAGTQSGASIVEFRGVAKSFGERVIARPLSLLVNNGDRLAIVGPNGAGKTTLLRLLTGQMKPDQGDVRLGTNLQIVTLDQSRASLDPESLVKDVITDGRGDSVTINNSTKHVVSYMRDFLFRPEQARTPVAVLSGGEKARLILAREFAKPSNVLILDEPTNDLDIETLDLLQEMLADYSGTIIIVSHDRDFLDRVATSVLMHEGDGKWIEYAGGYSDMVAQRGSGINLSPQVSAGSGQSRKQSVESQVYANVISNSHKDVAVTPRRKLSFNEKHALETIPAQLDRLEQELAVLELQLADATLFARDPLTFNNVSRRHAQAAAEKEIAETRWLELEMLRESLLAAD